MSKKTNLLTSSVGRKFLMGATGLFLCSFLVIHLSGNLLLFKNDGGIAFDAYSEFMATNLLIRTIEIGLFAGFLANNPISIVLIRRLLEYATPLLSVQFSEFVHMEPLFYLIVIITGVFLGLVGSLISVARFMGIVARS